MSDRKTDPAIEQIEAELRESRFKAWDVETFLANRHQARIVALTEPKNKWKHRWQVGRETFRLFAELVGYVVIYLAIWLFIGLSLIHNLPMNDPVVKIQAGPDAPPPINIHAGPLDSPR